MKIVNSVVTVSCLVFATSASAQNLVRDDGFKMRVETAPTQKPGVYKKFFDFPPSNENGCGYLEGDRALTFDLQKLAEMVGSNFDVNKLRFQANSAAAVDFMRVWQDHWEAKAKNGEKFPRMIPPLNGYDWSIGTVSFCVGASVSLLHPIATSLGISGVYLWHDSPIMDSQEICGQSTCDINSQTFSNGDRVGWYPKGSCSDASKWFSIVETNGGYKASEELQLGDVCICR